MTQLKRKKPCNDCPFRRNAVPGWTGNATPVAFLASTLAEHDMPCHLDIDYSDDDWEFTQMPEASSCAGSLIFFRNYLKSPRDAELAARVRGVERSPNVFQWPWEFTEYHMGEGLKEHEVYARAYEEEGGD